MHPHKLYPSIHLPHHTYSDSKRTSLGTLAKTPLSLTASPLTFIGPPSMNASLVYVPL